MGGAKTGKRGFPSGPVAWTAWMGNGKFLAFRKLGRRKRENNSIGKTPVRHTKFKGIQYSIYHCRLLGTERAFMRWAQKLHGICTLARGPSVFDIFKIFSWGTSPHVCAGQPGFGLNGVRGWAPNLFTRGTFSHRNGSRPLVWNKWALHLIRESQFRETEDFPSMFENTFPRGTAPEHRHGARDRKSHRDKRDLVRAQGMFKDFRGRLRGSGRGGMK